MRAYAYGSGARLPIAIDHQPLTALEQWKASRHRLLWMVVIIHKTNALSLYGFMSDWRIWTKIAKLGGLNGKKTERG